MEKRVNIQQAAPKAYQPLIALEGYLAQAQLSKTLRELVKIRASQINGCAFCLNMHTKDALKNGETNQRIFLLNAWRETELYTPEEKAALAMTEEVTLISQGGVSDATYREALQFFSEEQVAQLIMAVVAINAWNRIAISTRTEIED